MLEITGMDFYAEVAKLSAEQAKATIFLTGGAITARACTFLDEVKNERIEKPFDAANLRAMVNEWTSWKTRPRSPRPSSAGPVPRRPPLCWRIYGCEKSSRAGRLPWEHAGGRRGAVGAGKHPQRFWPRAIAGDRKEHRTIRERIPLRLLVALLELAQVEGIAVIQGDRKASIVQRGLDGEGQGGFLGSAARENVADGNRLGMRLTGDLRRQVAVARNPDVPADHGEPVEELFAGFAVGLGGKSGVDRHQE